VPSPLPAPSLLDIWNDVRRRLAAHATQPKLADAISELSEWYWEAACEELSDHAAPFLRDHPLARANFDALCLFDMDAGSDQSVAEHVLAVDRLTSTESRLLRELIHGRLRIVRLESRGDLGSHRAVDINSGQVFWVSAESWPGDLVEGCDYLMRLVPFPGIALIAGPCFPLPADRTDSLRREAEDLVHHLMPLALPDLRGRRERGLVDFHHQWVERWLGLANPVIGPRAKFSLLRGA